MTDSTNKQQLALITFLGTGNYQPMTYSWRGQSEPSSLFPTIVPKFFPEITAAKIFVTEQSEAMHGEALRAQWSAECEPQFVHIPSGATDDELWEIFDAIVREVPQDAHVVFDITHAFRSIPLISVLAVAYLWSTRNVQLHALIYGAFEARTGDPPVAPVFDLTPMVNLLEWLAAVQRFRHHLDGTPLSDLLDQIQRRAHKQRATDPPRQLQSAGRRLSQLTDALLLGRVREVLREAPLLKDAVVADALKNDAARWAKPLLLMLQPIEELLDEIGQAPEFDLAAHRRMARLYAKRRLFMPAISVFREWVVSRACEFAAVPQRDWCDETVRADIEKHLGRCIEAKKNKQPLPANPDWLQSAECAELIELWTKLPHIRNDVDHVGMKKEAKSASALIKNIRQFVLDESNIDQTDMHSHVTLDISTLYAETGTAKLADLPRYEQQARDSVPPGADVTLTGAGPVWLYLKIGHALHGRARRLFYDSPVTQSVLVFDHSPE